MESEPGSVVDATAATEPVDLRCYVAVDDRLALVDDRDGALVIRTLGSVDEARALSARLGFHLRGAMLTADSRQLASVERYATALDAALGHPGRAQLPAAAEVADEQALGQASKLEDRAVRPVVVSLPPALGAVPLHALPSLAGRPVLLTGAPSSRPAAVRPIDPSRRAVVVAGPDLAAAAGEAARVADGYPDAQVLAGPDATCSRTRDALAGAEIVHIAAHGRRSHDDPFFDSVHLVDGPLFVHELEWLDRAPGVVVLATCESALEHSVGGAQRLGLAPSLERIGVHRTVASPYPLPDGPALTEVMVRLHGHLRRTADPVRALASTVADAALTAESRAIAATFVCTGPLDR